MFDADRRAGCVFLEKVSHMPRYFFHLKDGISIADEDGSECADVAEARLEAIRFGGSLLRDFPQHEDWRVIVKDEAGADVVQLVFSVRESVTTD